MAKSDDTPILSVVNLPSAIPKPPATLNEAGANLWRTVLADFVIDDAGSLCVLEQAAAAYGRAEALREAIDRDGEILLGRHGLREHPGLKAELQARAFVVRALSKLGVVFENVRPGPGRPPATTPAWRR
jgi:hypothetical protein